MSDSLNGRLFYYPVHTEQNECGCRLLQIILSATCKGTVSVLHAAVRGESSVCMQLSVGVISGNFLSSGRNSRLAFQVRGICIRVPHPAPCKVRHRPKPPSFLR